MTPLPLGSRIGILGAGQLGRMLAMAAARLGYRARVYAPEEGPAGQVAPQTVAPWTDEALDAFAQDCDVVTFEFENVPLHALDRVSGRVPIRPGRRSLEISRDRLSEKDFLNGLGLRTARYRDVKDPGNLDLQLREIGVPAILKTRRSGYDGKGQVWIHDPAHAARELANAGRGPWVLEGVVSYEREVSVIVARGMAGETACYDVGENRHVDGILRDTTVPARVAEDRAEQAKAMAVRIAEALGHVGVMGVELFDTGTRGPDGLVVNEIAPRVHNSGHWTEAACAVDQFERHVRAIAGLPLGDGRRYADARMENLVGPRGMAAVPDLMERDGVRVHLYGKGDAREGRKMGHAIHILR